MCRTTGSRSSMSYHCGSIMMDGFSHEKGRTVDVSSLSRKTGSGSPAFGIDSHNGRRIPSERRHQIVMVLTVFALLGLAGAAWAPSGSRPDPKSRMERLANKVVELKREARRARALESEERRLEGELSEQREEIQKLQSLESNERAQISSLRKEVEKIKKEEDEKEEEVEDLLDVVFEQLKTTRNEEAKRLRAGPVSDNEKAVGLLEGHYKELAEKVQARSRDHVLERFGPGPHRVMIKIEIPDDEHKISLSDGPQQAIAHDLGTIVIEMAPLDLMPHSVQVFLDQVHGGLWNGCSFYRNAFHVLQASHKNGAANVTERFVNSGLANTKFQEYNAEFPHEKYTVGFGGANAGSVLMINKVDNTEVHGPGGQKDSFGVNDGEPCFGKVVAGFDTIEWLSTAHTSDEKGPDYLDNYVKILSASVV